MAEHPNLSAALVAALAGLSLVEASHKANAGNYSYEYASISDVVKATRPVLAEHGLVALTPVKEHGSGLECTVVLLHTSGERMEFGPFPFPLGRDAQATGSMVTYHRRYALVSALGMGVGDDDDGASAKPAAARRTGNTGPGEATVVTAVAQAPLGNLANHQAVQNIYAGLPAPIKDEFMEWWEGEGFPKMASGTPNPLKLSQEDAVRALDKLDELDKDDTGPADDATTSTASSPRQGVESDPPSEGPASLDAGEGTEAKADADAAALDGAAPSPANRARAALRGEK